MNRQGINKPKKDLRCKLISSVLVWGYSLAGYPFLVPTQALVVKTGINWNVNRQDLKTLAVFLFRYLRSVILLIAGLFNFGDQRRITPVNHAPRPSGSFVQDVPCSFLVVKELNYLKTFYSGLVGLRLLANIPRGILVMVRMGQEFNGDIIRIYKIYN